ncbi:MAG TPA: hypothetical protein VJI75_06075 [Candidatus Nanoarchaeia archaeon]|nr:hypothetical protein [Candidatus Nanoarchaeia archaeon]
MRAIMGNLRKITKIRSSELSEIRKTMSEINKVISEHAQKLKFLTFLNIPEILDFRDIENPQKRVYV